MPHFPANSLARNSSRLATARSSPFADAWIAGLTAARPILAVLKTPKRSFMATPRKSGRMLSEGTRPSASALVGFQGQLDPTVAPMGERCGVDDLLHPGALGEVALVHGASLEDLLAEVVDEVPVEGGGPRIALSVSRREVFLRNLPLNELHLLPGRRVDRLDHAELLHEPH